MHKNLNLKRFKLIFKEVLSGSRSLQTFYHVSFSYFKKNKMVNDYFTSAKIQGTYIVLEDDTHF